jgi:hypothetical protein
MIFLLWQRWYCDLTQWNKCPMKIKNIPDSTEQLSEDCRPNATANLWIASLIFVSVTWCHSINIFCTCRLINNFLFSLKNKQASGNKTHNNEVIMWRQLLKTQDEQKKNGWRWQVSILKKKKYVWKIREVRIMVFNATFNNISAILWRSNTHHFQK